jgi:hypothetical protein
MTTQEDEIQVVVRANTSSFTMDTNIITATTLGVFETAVFVYCVAASTRNNGEMPNNWDIMLRFSDDDALRVLTAIRQLEKLNYMPENPQTQQDIKDLLAQKHGVNI